MEYRTIAAPVSASFVEKKSEFIAQLFPVRTQEDAVEAIENVRKQHRRARHNVYAYLLREGNASRYSDDGEPQGTAGMPILDVLQKNGLTDICCVVTRYFGGVLLGANGLVRAYSHSTALAIENAQFAHFGLGSLIHLLSGFHSDGLCPVRENRVPPAAGRYSPAGHDL